MILNVILEILIAIGIVYGTIRYVKLRIKIFNLRRIIEFLESKIKSDHPDDYEKYMKELEYWFTKETI